VNKVIQEFASELPGENFNRNEEFLSAVHPFYDGGQSATGYNAAWII